MDIVACSSIFFPSRRDDEAEVFFVEQVSFFETSGVTIDTEHTIFRIDECSRQIFDTQAMDQLRTHIFERDHDLLIERFDGCEVFPCIVFFDRQEELECSWVKHRKL